MQNLLEQLKKMLTKDERLVVDGELLKNKVIELGIKLDAGLLKLLLADKQMKKAFFEKVGPVKSAKADNGASETLVFDKDKFVKFVSNKQFLPDSYTAFKNKIGLTEDGEFIREKKEVVLSWPYKDCVLEGGMTKEDQKRDEIFWNQTLAPDEISRLLDPKVFTNAKRVDAKGPASAKATAGKEHKFDGFRIDKDGNIKDNLIIKGNNLLALHSLKKRFAGKVKLIYIDPPYNPDSKSNTFIYNNSFNESSWLTFIKNRLEVAKSLLTNDGVLIVAIDENEFLQLGVLLKEVFKDHESHCITIVHNPRGVQGTNFSYTHEYAFFVIPKGKKSVGNRKIDDPEIGWSNLRNWGGESLRTDAKNCFYPVIVENGEVVGFGEVLATSKHPKSQTEKRGEKYYIYPIDTQGVERKWRYARQSVEEVKHLLKAKKTKSGFEIEIGKDFGSYRTVWIDPRYDANEYGTKLVKSLVPDCEFDFPKSLWNVYDCLYAIIADDKDALVLDFFAGSGTTAHAVLELNKDGGNRKFIIVEQMDYVQRCTVPRVQKVLNIEKSEDSFVYMELTKWNEDFVDEIKKAKTTKGLQKLWETLKLKAYLSYKVDSTAIDANAPSFASADAKALADKKATAGKKDFADLSVEDQKRFLLECLDQNHLYINYSEIDDKEYAVSEVDKKLNKEFYGK